METINFSIDGQVVDAATGNPVANLKVEAWDKDTKFHDLLGIGVTDGQGRFQMEFDSNYFGLDDRQGLPDIFFKVWRGRRLLLSTQDKPLTNAGEKTEVVLSVGLPPPRPVGKDRINTSQAFNIAGFFRDSDFGGAIADIREKSSTSLSFVSDMVLNSFAKFDWKPIKKGDYSEQDIVGNETANVREDLESNHVEVEVQPYNPKLNAASVKDVRILPVNLKAGQKVRLYEENGKVRYYTIIKESSVTTTSNEDLAAQKLEVQKLKTDLGETKQLLADKDKKIAQLQEELKIMRKEHEDFGSILKSDAFLKMMKNADLDATKKAPKKKA